MNIGGHEPELFWDIGGGKVQSIMTGAIVARVAVENLTADEAQQAIQAVIGALSGAFAPPKVKGEFRDLPRAAWHIRVNKGLMLVCRKHLVTPDGSHSICWERVGPSPSVPADDYVTLEDLEGMSFRVEGRDV
jgi:hypothetical protein